MRRRDFLGTGAVTLIGGLTLDRVGFDVRAALAQSSGVLSFDLLRCAVVIGNGAYTRVPALHNPTNDARSITGVMHELSFRVDYAGADPPEGAARAIAAIPGRTFRSAPDTIET